MVLIWFYIFRMGFFVNFCTALYASNVGYCNNMYNFQILCSLLIFWYIVC